MFSRPGFSFVLRRYLYHMNVRRRLGIYLPYQSSCLKLCCALLVITSWLAAEGATVTWNGSVSSDWFNPTNWTPDAIPASGDTVNISSGFINLTAPATIDGQFNWSGGTLMGNPLTIATNGVLNIEGSISLQNTLSNYGTVSWQAGTVAVYNDNGPMYEGAIWNQAGALWDIQCDQTLSQYYGSEQFNNAGLLRKSAGTNTTLNPYFVNSGTVDVESGTIQFSSENNVGGSFQSAANTAISGNIAGTFSGTINWLGGQINSGAPLTVASNGVLNIAGSITLYDALTNYGTVNWQAGAIQLYNNGDSSPGSPFGAIWNEAGALWDIQCDQSMNQYYGQEQFNNAGLLRKSAGTNTTTLGLAFVNSGAVDAESGTIQFSGGVNLGSGFQTAANAAVNGNISGTISNTLNWSGGSLTAGSYLTVASNGVLNISGNITLYGAMTNYGTVNWQAGTVQLYNNGSSSPGSPAGAIWNQTGALWEIQCDQSMSQYFGQEQFNNAGLLRKSAGTNTTTLGLAFVNGGTVDAESGTIPLAAGAVWAGTIRPRPTARFIFTVPAPLWLRSTFRVPVRCR